MFQISANTHRNATVHLAQVQFLAQHQHHTLTGAFLFHPVTNAAYQHRGESYQCAALSHISNTHLLCSAAVSMLGLGQNQFTHLEQRAHTCCQLIPT